MYFLIKPSSLSRCINFYHTTNPRLAGHSKWANIKHIKALKDGQRATVFMKLTRQMRLAIQDGGGSSNPMLNSVLRSVIDEALKKNMPMSTIQSTIKRFEQNKLVLKKYFLEIRIFNKVYAVCTIFTDNLPALKMTMAPILKKNGASYVDAKHLFDDRGVITVIVPDQRTSKTAENFEANCIEDAINCGAEEVEIIDQENGLVNFLCDPIDLDRVTNNLRQMNYQIETAEHCFVPKITVQLNDSEQQTFTAFCNKLKACDGIEEIYDNINQEIT